MCDGVGTRQQVLQRKIDGIVCTLMKRCNVWVYGEIGVEDRWSQSGGVEKWNLDEERPVEGKNPSVILHVGRQINDFIYFPNPKLVQNFTEKGVLSVSPSLGPCQN